MLNNKKNKDGEPAIENQRNVSPQRPILHLFIYQIECVFTKSIISEI